MARHGTTWSSAAAGKAAVVRPAPACGLVNRRRRARGDFEAGTGSWAATLVVDGEVDIEILLEAHNK